MRKIKDWGVVKFLTKKVPEAAGDIIGAVSDVVIRGKNPVSAVADLVTGDSKVDLSPEDLKEAIRLAEIDWEREKAHIEDRQNARQMQIEISSIKDSSWLAKNYVYLMSTWILLTATFFGVILVFYDIPVENKRLVEMFADIYLFAGAIAVIQFFLGSSLGSKGKEEDLSDALRKFYPKGNEQK